MKKIHKALFDLILFIPVVIWFLITILHTAIDCIIYMILSNIVMTYRMVKNRKRI